MKPDEAKKLLGGYATGTLTPEEREALMAAALEDQDLFDAIAREEALRETLEDPAVRADLLDAVSRPRRRSWFAWWPVPAGAAAVALAGITVFVMTRATAPIATEVAQNRPPATIQAPLPEPGQKPKASQETLSRSAPAQAVKLRGDLDSARASQDREKEAGMVAQFKKAEAAAPQERDERKQAAAPAAPPPAGVAAEARDVAAAPMAAAAPPAVVPQAQQLYDAPARQNMLGGAIAVQAIPNATRAARTQQAESDLSKRAEQTAAAFPLGVRYTRSSTSLTLEVNDAAFVNIFRNVAGAWTPMQPERTVRANTPISLDAPTTDRLVIVASRRPLGDRSTAAVERLRTQQQQQLVTARTGELNYAVAQEGAAVVTVEATK